MRDHLIAVEVVPVTPAGTVRQELYFWAGDEPVFRYVRRGISYFPSGRVREIDVFDARNGTNPTSVMYGYDAQGHRVYGIYTDGATGARVDRLFFYGPNDHLISMREIPVSPAGPTQYENYYWLDDAPVFRYVRDTAGTALERTFLYDDHLGTPRAAVAVDSTMATPAVIYQASREAFLAGAPVQSPGAGYRPVRLRFPGQWSDDGTAMWGSTTALLDDAMSDLSNNQAREYEPGLGGYTAFDPIIAIAGRRGFGAVWTGAPVFGYADSRPTQYVDPTGFDFTLALPFFGPLTIPTGARALAFVGAGYLGYYLLYQVGAARAPII